MLEAHDRGRSVLPHQSFENRAVPLHLVDKSNQLYCDDGWLLHTICFYGSNERQGISIFAFTDSVGQTPPFHSTKSLLNASMRGFTNRMYAMSPLPPSLLRALVCAHFHHGRIRRGSRGGTSCDPSGTDRSGAPNQCQYAGRARAGLEKPFWRCMEKRIFLKFSLLSLIKQRAFCSVRETLGR